MSKAKTFWPRPPKSVTQSLIGTFEPAPSVEDWFRRVFLSSESQFYNLEHEHLNSAEIGVLWTNVMNRRQMRRIVGEARLAQPQAKGAWAKGREEMQVREWFGADRKLDFIITLDAVVCGELSDEEFCALIDHELYHCAQAVDAYGCPKFSKDTGRPIFAMRGHDVEEFVGVVRRWGALDGDTQALIRAGSARPEFSISRMCGVAA